MRKHKTSQAGFSLVELAIALMIIGLIVGGILKGQELLESARLKSILTQINEYRVATSTFIDRYDALPGDFDQATELINEKLLNGNNNGVIDGPGLIAHSKDHEAASFWAHLAAANLIPNPGTSTGNYVKFGAGAPKAKIGGGFTICYHPYEDMPGHWFLLGNENGEKGDAPGLTPLQAMSLDKKADDGNPTTGKIRAKDGAGTKKGSCVTLKGEYNTKNNEKACVVYFQM